MATEFSIRGGFFHKIRGVLDTPAGEGPFPTVVICHGFTGHKQQDIYISLTDALTSFGFATVRFDFTTAIDAGIANFHVRSELRDLQAVFDKLEDWAVVDPSRAGLVGHSYGATIALLFAGAVHTPRALACLSPKLWIGERGDQTNAAWLTEAARKGYFEHATSDGRRFRVNGSFLRENFRHYDRLKRALLSVTAPTLIVYGDDAQNTDDVEGQTIFQTLRCRKRVHVVRGGDHAYRKPRRAQSLVGRQVARWFAATL